LNSCAPGNHQRLISETRPRLPSVCGWVYADGPDLSRTAHHQTTRRMLSDLYGTGSGVTGPAPSRPTGNAFFVGSPALRLWVDVAGGCLAQGVGVAVDVLRAFDRHACRLRLVTIGLVCLDDRNRRWDPLRCRLTGGDRQRGDVVSEAAFNRSLTCSLRNWLAALDTRDSNCSRTLAVTFLP
jgi:hypothetical protein